MRVPHTSKRILYRFTLVAIAVFVALPGRGIPNVLAQQLPLASKAIPQFVDQLPFIPMTGGTSLELHMCEFKANVLPTGTFAPGVKPETWVWGYQEGTVCDTATTKDTYLGPIVIATRGTPTTIKYVNNLGTTSTSNVLAYKNSTDQTLHWADPANNEANACMHAIQPGQLPGSIGPLNCALNYGGAIPAVVHLHGGEVPPQLDGGPDGWFTSNGTRGHAYYSKDGTGAKNYAIYRYPNTQEAAPLWFHDHTLGVTRLNVYAGLAGGYVIVDPLNDPTNLPTGRSTEPLIPLVIQDRMFDTTGQLLFPNAPINPEHPFWVPEFVGDVIVVNGKAWPNLNLEAKRYRFLFLNGSNARTYEMSFGTGTPMWQIGTDGGYLDAPVRLTKLILMPGERADVIIDFAGLAGNQLILRNTARTPFPGGVTPQGTTTGRIMQFTVTPCKRGTCPADTTFNPATPGATLRGGTNPGPAIVRLTPTTGTNATPIRRLTLNEVIAPPSIVNGIPFPGGPLEVIVNNTKYSGHTSPTQRTDFETITKIGPQNTDVSYYSELPKEGATEVWEIINLTADAHPIHLHLSQFQLLSRTDFDVKKYLAVYNAAFPCTGVNCIGTYLPSSGPPFQYAPDASPTLGDPRKCSLPNAVCGGNPDVTPFLQKKAQPPAPNELGWKDTVMMLPGQVTRIAVRWAPTDASSSTAYFPFNPEDDGHGYVWHCHIIDHEDNDMMRPDLHMQATAVPSRSYTRGTDY